MSSNGEITDWKRLWQLISGIHYETPEDTVKEKLLNVSKELQDGLLQFKSSNSSNTNLETLLKEKKQEKLYPFTKKLQELLDLESSQCWQILCYYLSNEYRGSASSLTAFISSEGNMAKLLDDIWGYYSLERMIVLKVMKNLLIFYKIPGHPYHNEYRLIVDKLSMTKLRDSYLKQLEFLIDENPPTKLTAGEFLNYHNKLNSWAERNCREINETLHILLLITDHVGMPPKQLQKLFDCFKKHSFGRQQRYIDPMNELHQQLIRKIAFSEVALFLKSIDFPNPQHTSGADETIKLLDKDITSMYHNEENGPMLLSWMLLNLRSCSSGQEDNVMAKYGQFGVRAVHLNVFGFLKELVSHEMFKDDSVVSKVVRKTIYNLLTYLCDLFDADGSVSRHPFVYELLCELISWPTLAKDFCALEDGGVRSLYNTALESFPLNFIHISMIANALSKAGMGPYIKSQLESLPIYTEIYDDNKFMLQPSPEIEDEYVLVRNFSPFPRIDYTIRSGTSAVVMERSKACCVHFRTNVNYFNVLHYEINCLLDDATRYTEFNNDRLTRINFGLKYLQSAILRVKSLNEISAEMVHPTELCIDVLNKFKLTQNPPIELLANCLNVCTALLPLVDKEIFNRVINLSIFPALSNETLDYKKYAHGVCFDSNLVGTYLVDVEKKTERYEFLMAYLGFLRTYAKMGRDRLFQLEIPGLIFLLREVFPHMHAWRFESQHDKNKIYSEIMGFICDILDMVTTEKGSKNPSKQLLRNICVYSLLNLENGLVLLRFIAIGNPNLQLSMEMESNWMVLASNGLILLVRLSMRILMQLLRLKTSVFSSSELSPLEALIYTQPKQRDTLRIIPVVTSYMNNIFDRWLPLLSCRLLKRIALEFNMSLLACLDMEPDQIRLTFLNKLPDDLESDNLKIAILELVEACIEKQPGVTEAFFNVNFSREKTKDKKSNLGDSIVTFMEDYLDAVAKVPNAVENPLPSRIMTLFHSLWKNNMQSLVEELVQKPTFWSSLCNPLFAEVSPNVKAYSQLFNILGIEVFCTSNKTDTELKKVLNKFFESSHFDVWLEYVFELPNIPRASQAVDETPEWLNRLQAFKGFMLIYLKKNPTGIEIPQKKFKLLAEKCLQVLVERSEYTEDLRPFIILSELYLFIIQSYKHSYTESAEEDRIMLQQLIKLLSGVASCYEDLHIRAKEACLSITIKCADLLAVELLKDSTVALSFLYSVVSIICRELSNLETEVKVEMKLASKSSVFSSSSNSLILSLNLLKTIATIFHNDGPGNWDLPFIANKVFNRLLSCTGWILQLSSKQKLSVELLDVLIVFAKGNCSQEFLYCDVGDYLWLKLLPPKELLQATYAMKQPRENDWAVQKWWPIYSRGIELVTILFQKHGYQFLKNVLTFVGIHEEYLMDSLLLGKQSLEPSAMVLIKNSVLLVAKLVDYEKEWRLEHSHSLFNLMRCVQMLMGHSISMFNQPKNLKSLVMGRRTQLDIIKESESGGLVDEVITAFNDLTEIITLCAKCLLRFSPPLIDLICEPEFLACKWEPLFEIHFGAPKLNDTNPQLTFGTVLSVIGVFTKVLNLQNYGFNEVPLNVLPENTELQGQADGIDSPSRNTTGNNLAKSPSQRGFSKSVSITSASSVSAPPNELLSNLDGELCLMALEHVLMLAASQSLLAFKNCNLPSREKQLIRREISTELITYHEFIRKKVLIDFREHKEIWHRRKHGIALMMKPGSDDNDFAGPSRSSKTQPENGTRRVLDHKNSMRVNVVRRLHLQSQQQQRTPDPDRRTFEMSQMISPIVSSHVDVQNSNQPDAISSTPNLSRPPIRRSSDMSGGEENVKKVCFEDEIEEEIDYYPAEEPKYSPLSYVQMVEEDYLHFMSNLFTVICQSD
ncbi:nucleoporin Nup188 [Episyrphus balteatus]|uniref:nucleoporin Nup188 n=1 Tax=Episyrphus balteatus TaxID=286459 RepID=UPI00248650DA|nr:nucleoporin Nup188 [Episyrphus balteatus]